MNKLLEAAQLGSTSTYSSESSDDHCCSAIPKLSLGRILKPDATDT
jgi:hypothetical protein